MKLVLFGANGQVGWELQRSLAPLGTLVAYARKPRPEIGLRGIDISDTDALVTAIRAEKPDVIVNAAACTEVDKAESQSQAAYATNATSPGVMATEAKSLGALFVHYSTDYVFDGKLDVTAHSGPPISDRSNTKIGYTESDRTNPQTVYGASKLSGENAILASAADALVFRLSWVFGVHGKNFPKKVLDLARTCDTLNVVADQYARPTPAALAADISAHIIRNAAFRPQGAEIYHLAAKGHTSRHAFAVRALELARAQGNNSLRLREENVVPVFGAQYPTSANRPANSTLNTEKLERLLASSLPDWDSYLAETVASAVLAHALSSSIFERPR